MNASDKVSRHGHDERVRVLGACHRLDLDDSPEGVIDAVATYGQRTVEAAIAYRERRAKEATIRDSKGPMKVLLQSLWLRTRIDEVNRYLRDNDVSPIERPVVDMRRAQSAIHQLDADPSPYGIALATRIHGKPMIDEIMIMRLYNLRAEARESGITMSLNDLTSGLEEQIRRARADIS